MSSREAGVSIAQSLSSGLAIDISYFLICQMNRDHQVEGKESARLS